MGSGWAAEGSSGGQRRAAAAAGRRRGRDDGLAPSFFTRYPPHDCLEGRGVVSGAYAANVSGFRMRGADHAGPREKLSATRSLSAPSERQRLSADETLAVWRVRRAGGTRLAHSNNAVCWLCVAQGRVYGIVVLAEFRWRFPCGACGALVVVGGCCLVARDGDHRVYGWGRIQTSKHPNIQTSEPFSPRPDRSRLPPRDSAFLLPSRWPSGEGATLGKAAYLIANLQCVGCV